MKTLSILLVDDNATFLRVATNYLEHNANVSVIGCANGGKEALTQAHKLRPDLVVIDLDMPDLPGLQVMPLLRNSLPGVGIIALTFFESEYYRKAALAAGANDFVAKANLEKELLPAIQRLAQDHGGSGSETS